MNSFEIYVPPQRNERFGLAFPFGLSYAFEACHMLTVTISCGWSALML